jgi:hypothetical protein
MGDAMAKLHVRHRRGKIKLRENCFTRFGANFEDRFRPKLLQRHKLNPKSVKDAESDADGFHLDVGGSAPFDAVSQTSPIHAVPLSLFSNRRLSDRNS